MHATGEDQLWNKLVMNEPWDKELEKQRKIFVWNAFQDRHCHRLRKKSGQNNQRR